MNDQQDFGVAFRNFMDAMSRSIPARRSEIAERLREFLGADAAQHPVVSHQFSAYDQPNVQLALEAAMDEARARGRSVEILGFTTSSSYYSVPRLQDLISGATEASAASLTYDSFLMPGDRSVPCLQLGIIMIGGADPLLIYVQGPTEHQHEPSVTVQVMTATRDKADAFFGEFRRRMSESNVYRGHSLIVRSSYRGTSVTYHPLPRISRGDLILDEATLERIERQTISFASHAKELVAAGRHLKRGVLLYGPPGTGKTLSAMYLASRMEGRTVLLTAGLGHGSLASVCAFARMLQPATVILEDVDLVAQDREHSGECSMPLLFEMLNQMDGLNEDADVLFILTTNRPEALEPALSARPGRIDQAIEVPLPDDACRERLFHLYSRGTTLRVESLDRWVSRTKGASAAFLRELMRRATLLALLDNRGALIDDRALDESMRELTLSRSLTGKFLGFAAG
jgi:hypothetical protein